MGKWDKRSVTSVISVFIYLKVSFWGGGRIILLNKEFLLEGLSFNTLDMFLLPLSPIASDGKLLMLYGIPCM